MLPVASHSVDRFPEAGSLVICEMRGCIIHLKRRFISVSVYSSGSWATHVTFHSTFHRSGVRVDHCRCQQTKNWSTPTFYISGFNFWIGSRVGAKTETDCCQILLIMIGFNNNRTKIYDNTFKKCLRRKCSKVIFITIKICSASWLYSCWIGTS